MLRGAQGLLGAALGPARPGAEAGGRPAGRLGTIPAGAAQLYQFYVLGFWVNLSNGFGGQKQLWKPLVPVVAASPVISPSASES